MTDLVHKIEAAEAVKGGRITDYPPAVSTGSESN